MRPHDRPIHLILSERSRYPNSNNSLPTTRFFVAMLLRMTLMETGSNVILSGAKDLVFRIRTPLNPINEILRASRRSE
jgi:hypothetical protein